MPRSRGAPGAGGRLRVIAGELRGRKLWAPPGRAVRPTADRVREALFDILGRRVAGSIFLDAYAGTGAVGIEALSRGASEVTFIENDPVAVNLLERNLQVAGGAAGRTRVVPADLARAIPTLESVGRRFDILYLDPPYAGGELDRALRLLTRSSLVAEGAALVAEHAARDVPPEPAGWAAIRTAAYGRAALTFFGRRDPR